MKYLSFFGIIILLALFQACEKMPKAIVTCNKTIFKVNDTIEWDASLSLNTHSYSWRVDTIMTLNARNPTFKYSFSDTGVHVVAVTCVNKKWKGYTEEIYINVVQ